MQIVPRCPAQWACSFVHDRVAGPRRLYRTEGGMNPPRRREQVPSLLTSAAAHLQPLRARRDDAPRRARTRRRRGVSGRRAVAISAARSSASRVTPGSMGWGGATSTQHDPAARGAKEVLSGRRRVVDRAAGASGAETAAGTEGVEARPQRGARSSGRWSPSSRCDATAAAPPSPPARAAPVRSAFQSRRNPEPRPDSRGAPRPRPSAARFSA
jgi:hypothetical protein